MSQPSSVRRALATARLCPVVALALFALAACGGGGGGGGGGGSTGGGSNSGTWVTGVFQPSSTFDARCVAPRSGTSDVTGTVTDQNNWLRSWTNELYLWYGEVPDLNPALYQTADYFSRLETSATTVSGQKKDKFHFTYPTDVWLALSQGGQEVAYGLQWALVSTVPPRRAVVAFVEPNQSGTNAAAGLARGMEVLSVDGVDIDTNTQAGVNTLNAGLFPNTAGESHTFRIRELSGTLRDVTLQSANVTTIPVQNVKTLAGAGGPGTVGYIQFNDHIATSEAMLIDAINTLRTAGVTDLVLDIRYNGGGFLDIASELAFMIAGPTATAGQTFELQQFNDKNPTTNPVTEQAITPTPFLSTSSTSQALPTLNLPRVFVLTGANTCSASEAIINGLRGVNVDVIQIGSTTCGKPYGFYPADNCGTTYFSIEFRGVNAKNFGDYTDGFSPANSTVVTGVPIPGCSVADDFTHALSDPAEGRLAEALSYQAMGHCTSPPSGTIRALSVNAQTDVITPKSPWRQNRIYRN